MTSYSPSTSVTCRIHPAAWLAVVVVAVQGSFVTWTVAHAPTTRGGTPAQGAAISALCFGFTLIVLSMALLRVRVTGDQDGLTWTGFLATNHASWAQVRSVGEENVMGKRVTRVRTEVGNISMNSSMTNKDAMVALIESRIGGKGGPLAEY